MDLKRLQSEVLKNKAVELELERDLAFQIGRQVERARLKGKMTQETLAKVIGTHQPSIARTEGGTSLPSLSFLKKIADALGAHLSAPRFIFNTDTQTKMRGEMVMEQSAQGVFLSIDGKPLGMESDSSSNTAKFQMLERIDSKIK